ncbi:MAG: hypothetical protein L3K08_06165 [Thermoplasmata archaeon]|nr:hypothetical protein [Thermoplasmata archaeon]
MSSAVARRVGRKIPALLLVLFLPYLSPAGALAPPPISISADSGFLSNLSAPVLAPGGSGLLQFHLSDPLTRPLSQVSLTFELYAFAPAPGGSSSPMPSGAMSLSGPQGSGTLILLTLPPLAPGSIEAGSVGVIASGGAGDGGYSVRSMLTFAANGSSYRFESRGYFSDAAWNAATQPAGASGPSELNLSRLGVDGITPETAVGVHTDPWLVPVLVLVGAGVLVAGIGAVYYFRRGPGSRSGATAADDPHSAPSAWGK